MSKFGDRIRTRREALHAQKLHPEGFSQKALAARVGVSGAYLCRLEKGDQEVSSAEIIEALAHELGENADVLLALAGKVSPRLVEIIAKRPELFASVIEQFADLPDHAIVRVVREVRDGEW